MNYRSLKILEFDKILSQIASFASSTYAREVIKDIKPLQNLTAIQELLLEVEEADKILFQHAINPNFSYDDIGNSLDKADIMSVLSMGELIKIGRVLRVARALQSNIYHVPDNSIVLLKDIAREIYTDKQLEEDIDKCILSDTEMHDNASPELRSIRSKIRRVGENIKTKLHSFISGTAFQKYIQDNIVTIRNDRYVIPVKAEYRSSIPGLIHDQSASGQTIYIEPMAIVELNNDLKTFIIQENQEVEKILRTFTMRVSSNVNLIKVTFEKITQLDIIFAKAMYANANKGVKPIINNKGYINIIRGRHPLIDKSKVVPTTVSLGKNYNMLFITGPNTGGKTVSIKLVGLFTIMALSGIFVPASEAELSMFNNIYCDIGDEQSIEQSLSTFSSHIANIINILDDINPQTLILLDELGAGTDPTEGASLAVAISNFIRNSGAKAVITTHYNELKEYAVVMDGVENASMDFDPVTYNPTYKLIVGTPGASNALLIAKKLGIKESIIAEAQEGIKSHKVEFENVLQALEIARRNAVSNQEETDKDRQEAKELLKHAENERNRLFLQREKLNENVKKETKRLVEEAMTDANEIIEQLKELLDNPSESNIFEAHKLRKSLTKYVINEENEFRGFGEEADGEIAVGDTVLVISLGAEGIVEAINPIKNEVKVNMGNITSNIKLPNLTKLKTKPVKPKIVIEKAKALRNQATPWELNLIGKNTDECVFYLDTFVDQAVLGMLSEIRVIHGYGTGVLREAVQRHLRKHPCVESIRDGIYGEGERGVTFAKLK